MCKCDGKLDAQFNSADYTPKVTYLSCPGGVRNDPKREVFALPLYYIQSLNYALLEVSQIISTAENILSCGYLILGLPAQFQRT